MALRATLLDDFLQTGELAALRARFIDGPPPEDGNWPTVPATIVNVVRDRRGVVRAVEARREDNGEVNRYHRDEVTEERTQARGAAGLMCFVPDPVPHNHAAGLVRQSGAVVETVWWLAVDVTRNVLKAASA
jgi:hypothetical protein